MGVSTDQSTTPTGEWREPYAGRIHLLTAVADPIAEPGTFDVSAYTDPQSPAAQAMAAFGAPFGDPEPTEAVVADAEIDGPHGPVPVRIYRHPSAQARSALVWIHGGAFIGGDLDMPEADLVAKGLVTRTHSVVVSVFYRLCAGGVHHPVPHDDCWAAFEWTRAHAADWGVDPSRVAVGGASAGGNLAASVALRGRDSGTPPWQALLAYPLVHAPLPAPSADLAAALDRTPPLLRFPEPVTTFLNENYLGGPVTGDLDPYAFAGHAADLAGYPATYIENAEFDDLRASGEAFGLALAAAGVDVEVVTAAGVPHGHLNAVGSPLTSASLDRFAARLTR